MDPKEYQKRSHHRLPAFVCCILVFNNNSSDLRKRNSLNNVFWIEKTAFTADQIFFLVAYAG
jgi:predicted transcriptional regulator